MNEVGFLHSIRAKWGEPGSLTSRSKDVFVYALEVILRVAIGIGDGHDDEAFGLCGTAHYILDASVILNLLLSAYAQSSLGRLTLV